MPVVWDWTQPGPVSPEPSTSGLEHEVVGLAALATLPGACVARVSHLCAQSVTLEPGSNTRRRWRACATQSAVSAALADPNAALPAGARRMTHEEREGDRASACEACGALCAERLTCARVFLRVRMCRARQHNLRGVGETGVHVTRWCLTSLACTISLYLARSRSLLTHVHARTHARTRTRTRTHTHARAHTHTHTYERTHERTRTHNQGLVRSEMPAEQVAKMQSFVTDGESFACTRRPLLFTNASVPVACLCVCLCVCLVLFVSAKISLCPA